MSNAEEKMSWWQSVLIFVVAAAGLPLLLALFLWIVMFLA
jgi:hypothetical protein